MIASITSSNVDGSKLFSCQLIATIVFHPNFVTERAIDGGQSASVEFGVVGMGTENK